MAADMAQRERSNINCYVSTFSIILIDNNNNNNNNNNKSNVTFCILHFWKCDF